MKPIRLKLKNFGTFVKETNVDFTRFAETPFFLIHGNTGAGKTTLFDGICYALYEEGSSKYRDRNNLISHHAKDGEKLEVEFWFERGHRTFHIRRQFGNTKSGNAGTPKQSLTEVRANGEGYDPVGQPLTKKTEVDEYIKNTLQFDVAQFRKIIILPQGQFAEFLHARTDEKSKILHELFGTEAYERLTKKLKEEYEKRQEAVLELEKDVTREQKALRAENALGKYLSEEAPEDFEQALKVVEKESQQKQAEYEKYSKEVEAAQQNLNAQEQLAKSFHELEKLHKRQQAHQKKQPEIEAKQYERKAAQRADTLKNELERLRKQEEQLEKAVGKNWRTEVPKQCQSVPKESETQAQRDRKNELEKSGGVFEALEKAEKDLQTRQKQVKKAAAEETKKQQALETAKAKVKTLEEQIAQNEKALEAREDTEKRIRKIEKWEEQRQQHQQLREKVQATQAAQKKTLAKLQKEEKAWQEKQQNYQALFRQWRNDQARRLALDLSEGDPCPVCGATEHPQKATHSGEAVSDAALERAEKAENKARTKLDKTRQTLAGQRTETEATQKQLRELEQTFDENDQAVMAMPAEEFERKAQKSRQKHEQLRKTEEAQRALRNQQLPEAKNAQESAQKAYEAAQKAHQEAQSAAQVAEATCNERRQHLPEGFADKKALQAAIKALEKSITEGEHLRKLAEQWAQFREEENRILGHCQEQQFPDIKSARNALRTEAEREQLEKVIRDWENEKVELQTESQRLRKATRDQQKPDLSALQQQLKERKKQQSESSDEKARLLALHQAQVESLKTLRQTEQRLQAKYKEIKPYEDLYHLASGKNDRNQKFATYALSVFLDEVIRFANKRLALLSDDEFQMERFDQGRGKSVGLDIRVFNTNTGRYLNPKELSGGETFLHALALALGLADVVYAQSGGAKLDAMFIDEGFGTLDTEKQRKTLRVLSDNEGQHRMIGIISHVEQIKKMNVPKIHVLKEGKGSRVIVS